MSSGQNLVLTDVYPPAGAVEFDLDARSYLRFTLAPEQYSRQVQASIGFHARPGEPPLTKTCIDFSNRSPGAGPNPRIEQGLPLWF